MKKFFLLGFIVVLLAAVPLTLFLVKQQTKPKSSAAPSTTLSLSTASPNVNTGQSFPVDIRMDPGSNAVSFVKLNLAYDSTKLSASTSGITINTTAFPVTLEGPFVGNCSGNFCTISLTVAIGADNTKAITAAGTVATITFKALAVTDQNPTQITFGNTTQVLSVAQPDSNNENVLSSSNPLSVTIANGIASITPSPGLSPTDTPTPSPTSTVNATPTPAGGNNQPPVCTSLSVDQTIATAPAALAFTAAGNDPDGVVNKVSFTFGDGFVQDVTDGGGIGTNTVSTQISHTYQNPGTFTATSTLTDNNSAVSSATTPTNCTQTITINSSTSTGTGSAVTITPTPTLIAKIPPTGPGDVLVGVGIGGVILSILGGILFFAL